MGYKIKCDHASGCQSDATAVFEGQGRQERKKMCSIRNSWKKRENGYLLPYRHTDNVK